MSNEDEKYTLEFPEGTLRSAMIKALRTAIDEEEASTRRIVTRSRACVGAWRRQEHTIIMDDQPWLGLDMPQTNEIVEG